MGERRVMRIEIVRARTGWFFRFVARNGRTLCHSEIYTSKASCYKGVDSVVSGLKQDKYKWEEV